MIIGDIVSTYQLTAVRAFVALCDAFILCLITLESAITTIGPTASLASLSAMLPRIDRRIPDRI
ncbi:uncharacterized protein METZ01_LOCUS305164, partial [marine metagenome]